jgi:simple sugar transport system permease protein
MSGRPWCNGRPSGSLAAVLGAGAVGLVLVAAMGVSVSDALAAFADGAWGSPYAVASSLNRSLVLALVGLGFIAAQRAQLTNVGARADRRRGHRGDGGGPVRPCGRAALGPELPAAHAGGRAGRGMWGGLAGYLKAWRGTNEVIATLLLSFIATWMVYGAVQSEALLRQPMTSAATLPESLPIPESTQIPLLTGDYGMPLHAGLLLGLVLMVVVGVVLRYTVLGCSCMRWG